MKNAIILHGVSSNPEQFWFPYLKTELEKKGYDTWVPQLPEADNPQLAIQLPWLKKHAVLTLDTIIIAHSSGVPLTLALLETIETPIHQAILVSGFIINKKPRPPHIAKDEKYDWRKIRENAKHFVIINATNDPWGCNDEQGRKIFDHTGGLLVINTEGHMGSESFNQPYKKFPLLVKLVELAENG